MLFQPKQSAELTPDPVKQEIARRQLAVARMLARPGETGADVLRESYRRASQRLADR